MRSLVAHIRPATPLSRTRQQAVLLAALVTVLTEVAVLAGLLPYLDIGTAAMPVSVFPGAVVLWLLGRRAFGRRTSPGHSDPFWLAVSLGIGCCTILLVRHHALLDLPGVAIAAMGEEVVYRFAVPSLVAAILVSFKVQARPARIVGFSVGAVWFVLLPWHRAQMSDASSVLPFIAFAALAALVAYRSGSIAATAAVHTTMNLMTLLVGSGDISRASRSLAMACLLGLLVFTYGLIRTPRPVPAVAVAEPVLDVGRPIVDASVIDLRDGHEPSHTAPDGQVTPITAPVEVDQPR